MNRPGLQRDVLTRDDLDTRFDPIPLSRPGVPSTIVQVALVRLDRFDSFGEEEVRRLLRAEQTSEAG
jgi:hypothetical protein